jgi:Kef-type K+ transport system membrane component KefB
MNNNASPAPAPEPVYKESELKEVIVLSSFMFLLNGINWAFDKLFYAGVIGQIAFGTVMGSPVLKLLDTGWEETFQAMGDLGLICLIFEGTLVSFT